MYSFYAPIRFAPMIWLDGKAFNYNLIIWIKAFNS